MNRYEAMVILPESLIEEEIEKALATLVVSIKSLGGNAHGKPTRMGRKTFARPMRKQTAGEYALLRFELDGQKLDQLGRDLKRVESIFRIQFTRLADAAA